MRNNRKKILVFGNPLNHEGGMVEFNKGLIQSANSLESDFVLSNFVIGSRMYLFYYPLLRKILYPLFLILDLFRLFIVLVSDKKIEILQLNPSLIPVPILRDAGVLFLNKLFFKKKIIIVLHGWKEHFFTKMRSKTYLKKAILLFFKNADSIFVLSNKFKTELIAIGVEENKIKVTTTFFYEVDILPISTEHEISRESIELLFLGRISKLKGITELIDSIEIVSKSIENFKCSIVGHGDKPGVVEEFQKQVKDKGLTHKIVFLGRITGKEKFAIFQRSDIYVFPSYTEGCPTSVIEALANGCFVISSSVGALDEMIQSENGIKVPTKNVPELVEAIRYCIKNIDSIRKKKGDIQKNAMAKYEVKMVSQQFLNEYTFLTNHD